MLKETDLRIGNIVSYFVNEDGIEWDTTKIDWQDLKWVSLLSDDFNIFNRGLKITREILLKSGFVSVIKCIYSLNLQTHYLELIEMPDGFYPILIQPAELSSEIEQRVCLNRITDIHQLQNLVFTLKWKELKITL